jgi:hypothetical protein
MAIIIPEADYLKHYGVKGMKWGVRKDRTGATRKGNIHGRIAKGYLSKVKGAQDKYVQGIKRQGEVRRQQAMSMYGPGKMSQNVNRKYDRRDRAAQNYAKSVTNKAERRAVSYVKFQEKRWARQLRMPLGRLMAKKVVQQKVRKAASDELKSFYKEHWNKPYKSIKQRRKAEKKGYNKIIDKYYKEVGSQAIPLSPSGRRMVEARSNPNNPAGLPRLQITGTD